MLSCTVPMVSIPHSIRARRKLGQSFLVDTDVMRRMLREAGVTGADTALEVGPGPGTLTRLLAAKAKQVHAIEVDRQFRSVLGEVVSDHSNVEVRWGDARSIDLPDVDVVVSSLPYGTSLPILFRLLEAGITRGAVLLQDRQARRLAALPGGRGYSRVSVMAQRLATVELVTAVARDRFVPEPDVDSALVKFTAPARQADGEVELGLLRNLLDRLFLHRSDQLHAAMAAEGMGTAIGGVPKRVRRLPVHQVSPSDFDLIAAAVARAAVEVRPVSTRTKRRAN